MKVDKAQFDQIMADNADSTIGFTLKMERGTGSGEKAGANVTQRFIVENSDPIKEIGRLNGYMINLLTVHELVDEEAAGIFRILWRKIIKS